MTSQPKFSHAPAAKHTPGPWKVGDREPYVEVWGRMHMNAYPIIASLDCHPREANARLIAAAPELFEALALCVARDPSLKANAMVMQALAKAGG